MKTNKLSIGDWVLAEGKSAKVVALTSDKVSVESNNRVQTYAAYSIEPMPISVPFLELNGLEDRKVVELSEEENYTIEVFFKEHYDVGFMSIAHINHGVGDFDMHDMYIAKVHELQHLLRDCELDDIADNLKIC